MKTCREFAVASLLPDGRVLVVGDYGSANDGTRVPRATAEIYDPFAATFVAIGNVTFDAPYAVTTATRLANGKMLITSGTIEPVPPIPDVGFLYDPVGSVLTRTGDLIWNHAGPVATLLCDGKVLITEGRDPACETGPVLSRITADSITRLSELLPHNWKPFPSTGQA